MNRLTLAKIKWPRQEAAKKIQRAWRNRWDTRARNWDRTYAQIRIARAWRANKSKWNGRMTRALEMSDRSEAASKIGGAWRRLLNRRRAFDQHAVRKTRLAERLHQRKEDAKLVKAAKAAEESYARRQELARVMRDYEDNRIGNWHQRRAQTHYDQMRKSRIEAAARQKAAFVERQARIAAAKAQQARFRAKYVARRVGEAYVSHQRRQAPMATARREVTYRDT